MPATIRSSSSAVTATAQDLTVTVTKPAGTVDGDLLVAFFALRNPKGLITQPGGWELVNTVDVPPTPTVGEFMQVYVKAAASEPADYKWSWTVDSQCAVGMLALDVHDNKDVVVGVATASGTSHKTSDTFFTTEPNMLMLAAYSVNIQSSFTPPAGFAENLDVQSGASNGITLMVCNDIQVAKGLTGQFEGVSAATETGVAFVIGIRDPTLTEKVNLETGVKVNIVNAVNASAGVEVLSVEVGLKQSLRRLFISSAGNAAVRIEDTAGRILFPDFIFTTNIRNFGPVDFEPRRFAGGIGLAINVKSDSNSDVSVQIEADAST